MAPIATPTMPTPNPTVEIVAFVLKESIVDCDELGHEVFVGHALSSDDLDPRAMTPNTEPMTSPTPPTTRDPIARPLPAPPPEVGADATGVAGAAGIVGAAAGFGARPLAGGEGAAIAALGSGSRLKERDAAAPSCRVTVDVAVL
jgi:hypothetical protein